MNSDGVDGERAAALARIGGMGPGVSPEAERQRRPCRRGYGEERSGERGWGPRVFPRGRESPLEAERQRSPCQASGGGAPESSPEAESLRSRPRDSEDVPASGGGAPESYPEAESLRS